jgi:hypothetical protein
MKILKMEKLSRFFEKNSLKKLGQPVIEKKESDTRPQKSDTHPTLVVTPW